MCAQVYDYRNENVNNVLITPEIRARFQHMAPGQVDGRHSHDLGHEIFLVLEGCVEFDINGEKCQVGPGQMCLARADEIHQSRNVLQDKPSVLYLSVTPHIQPTHTQWIREGVSKQPPRFNPSSVWDVPPDRETPTQELVDRQRQVAQTLLAAAESVNKVQEEQLAAFEQGLTQGDETTMLEAREAIWDSLYPLFQQVYELADSWNALTYRSADPDA